ncbi:DUF1641 domain-containing protein [Metallosphaera tengchongensis]|uniref:DUF1641 domain-containing protein n=2 Tax=Metallosphaera tengchongensis TaxID=1532350 RepID=A0A6N0P041_9CREN|nr:DUF1641 domain-containing protein [Metallosphaera tengchongensis]
MEGQFIDRLLASDNLITVNKVLNLLNTLDKMGIIDVLNGALQDEEMISKLLGSVINDDTLSVIAQWDNLKESIKGLMSLLDPETISSLKGVLEIVKDLQSSGILDPIKGLLKDEETLGKIMSALVNDFTLNLMANWNNITKDLSSLNLENLKYYTVLVNEIGEAIKSETVKPVGLSGLLSAMRDPEVQKGLGLVISILRHIGKHYKSEKS